MLENKNVVIVINLLLAVLYAFIFQFVVLLVLGLLEGMGLLWQGAVTTPGSWLSTVVELASVAFALFMYMAYKKSMFANKKKKSMETSH